MTNAHQTPADNKMSAQELIALFADEDRHANALVYEMKRCRRETVASLAFRYGAGARCSDELSSIAREELARRAESEKRLMADNPALAALMGLRA